MNSNFYIYFDLETNKEIIKHRKLLKEFVLDTDDSQLLEEYQIDKNDNPYYIIESNLIEKQTPVYEAVFVDNFNDLDIKVQPIGTYLLDFLNLNLNNDSDLKKFAFTYGLDNLLHLDKSNNLNSYTIYIASEFEKIFNTFFDSIKNNLSKLQQEFKDTITFCFGDSGDKKIDKLNPKQRYFLSFHGCDGDVYFTQTPKFQKYSKGITIDFNSFFDTDIKLSKFTQEQLVNAVASESFAFAPYSYSCSKLENALFISFTNLINTNNLHINTCANCGKLFIPTSKSNEIYCDNPLLDNPSRTCKNIGADKKYKEKMREDEITKMIRDTSSCLGMRVKRNPDIKEHDIKYNNWKTSYPIQLKKYKEKKITKEELINWINNSRR